MYRLLEIIQYIPFHPDVDIESGVPSHTDAFTRTATLVVCVCDTLTAVEGYKEFILFFRFPFATHTASQTSPEATILKETQTEKEMKVLAATADNYR